MLGLFRRPRHANALCGGRSYRAGYGPVSRPAVLALQGWQGVARAVGGDGGGFAPLAPALLAVCVDYRQQRLAQSQGA